MQTKLNPYLNFRDKARQAMEFYHTIFGGNLRLQTFKEFHASVDPSEDNLIMHADLEGAGGIAFFASDTPRHIEYQPGTNISMSLTGDNEDELRAYFNKLAAGGMITMPLEKAQWGDTFGMCVDKFGIQWMVNISAQKM